MLGQNTDFFVIMLQ